MTTVAVTSVGVDEGRAGWEIHNLSWMERARGEFLCSPRLLEMGGNTFGLKLALGGSEDSEKGYVSAVVWCSGPNDLWVKMTLRLISWNGNKQYVEADERLVGYLAEKGKFVLPSAKTQWDFWGFVNLITLQELEQSYVKDDAMVLELEVHASEKKEVTHDVRPFLPRMTHAASTGLAADFAAILHSGENSDVKLRFPGSAVTHSDASADNAESGDASMVGELAAHRIVLAARSPVFAQMLFNSGMREASCAEVDLPDMCFGVAQTFLHCIYTDEVDNATWDDKEALCHLLAAVHKYQVKSLVSRIVARVAALLTEQCACERLMMADLLDIPELRTKVLDFMVSSRSRLSRVQATESYKRLGMQRPQLLMEILARLAPPEKPRAQKAHEISRIVL